MTSVCMNFELSNNMLIVRLVKQNGKLQFDNWVFTSVGDGLSLSRQDRTVVN